MFGCDLAKDAVTHTLVVRRGGDGLTGGLD